ncbi:MAG: bifunctional UDP-N-acetylmuramoyl-tripeptide:D-alanyl-D-alanine ligase/alanine racemase [Bacteroidales bacterium]|nr:bifunctional UDP-N-acetylmuramoyl-tripeptide:D-alanyl-D-alanine ligase/alanine racemase [Bacteroidales bacterium]
MPEYTITDLARHTSGKLYRGSGTVIRHLAIDSRKIFTAEDTAFFAIEGERHDGHDYISGLWEKGVKNFVVSRLPDKLEEYSNANFVRVYSALSALQQFAAYHRNQYDYPVIGITGSNGKTIVKEWIHHVLEDHYKIVRSPKSYNSQVGVPLSVWSMGNEYNLAVFEAGISHPNEMSRLKNIIRPEIGIFTNIGEAHQENFRDLSQKVDEKLQLFEESEVLIYCKDHEQIHKRIRESDQLKDKQLVSWSLEGCSDLNIESINRGNTHTTIEGEYHEHEVKVVIPYIDRGSIENAIHVWLLMLHLGIDEKWIQQKMADLPVVAMRLEMKKGINHCTLINDSYNSDLGSLDIALNTLNQQNQHRKKTLILSDILQSGREERELYNEVADRVHRNKVDRLIGIGEAISANRDCFELPKSFYSSTEQFMSALSGQNFRNEAILLKGSRKFYFEKISHALEEKMHQTLLEIDLDAMVNNLNYFRSILKDGTRIMAMVKAFSYGSGTYEIANVLQYQRVDYLGVAFADEGVMLREAGITMPIVVMNPEEESFGVMIDYDLEPEIYNFRVLGKFGEMVDNSGGKEYPVHVKLDTGMNRLGFKPREVDTLIGQLIKQHYLKVHSVFSHLAASNESDQDKFTRSQINLFESLSDKITMALGYPVIRHILNSAGIERFPGYQYDMVRLGIGLYGISAVDRNQLRNISTFKSTVTQVKEVAEGSTIGYGRKGKADRNMQIAVVPVGYADGLSRALSNGVGRFYINGYYVPVVGDICMDMCMVDITNCDIKEGDEVIVFGDQIPVTELAEKMGTIPYEIFTGISERVKRVYYQE